jgi:hypothetical protein
MEAFKKWLTERNINFRDGKGDYQVLQVETTKNGYQCIFSRNDMPEHYSVQDKLMPLVQKFIRENKAQKEVAHD